MPRHRLPASSFPRTNELLGPECRKMSTLEREHQLLEWTLASLRDRSSFHRRCRLRMFASAIRRYCLAVALFVSFTAACWAQPKSDLAPLPRLDPAEGERQASVLVARLLEQKPEQAVTN